MAAAYSIVFVRTADELRGGSRLVPVRVTGFNTHAVDSEGVPVDIYAEMRLDMSLIDVTQVGPIIGVVAEEIQILAQRVDVAGLSYLQDVNKAGQLIDLMEITVQTPVGDAAASFTWPLNRLYPTTIGPVIARHVAELESLLAL